jgi:hypothetical protein
MYFPSRLPSFDVYLFKTTTAPSHKLPTVVMARGIILVLIAALVVEVLLCRWLAREKWRPAKSSITIAAGIASVVGPACAVIPYTDYLSAFPSIPTLAAVWLLAAIGAIGIGIGVFAFNASSKVAGTICVLTNIPVLAYWGFIGAFFSMGGSR